MRTKLFYVLCFISIVLMNNTPALASGNGCAIHFEDNYDFISKIEEMGCEKGYPIMFYNYAATARWNVILPVRVAALSVCDMSKPITDGGAVGSKPYQFVMCTYSGEIRKIKIDKEHSEGWNWEGF